MKIIVKGGAWRNTEDEILKAAISKYGKNQWARISSLLSRKSPAQCKARWYEWLDPSIKKTEWSREEDEKLLHLAKLMPTQWRTIAPIVGRTANQCLERYQNLLDEAEQREAAEANGEEFGLTGTGGPEAGPSADDVRRLRPGEADPDPESRPARPDPIDMDEDEKEMLSEARARLANTQGKKAKRKARERQLEEARRLAMLQKRRELKAAGITMRMKPKKGQMDYNADIPFEKKAAPGFYDTTEEKNKFVAAPVGKSLRQLDSASKRDRGDVEEDERRKRQKKAKDAADKDAASHFVPAKDSEIQRQREEESILRRKRLVLPEAQVGDSELEDIVKIGQAGETARGLVDDGGEGASAGLLGEYSALQHAQTARTPRTPATNDNVMAEARNIRNMMASQTPLLGEANAPIHELVGRGTGFDGATPRGNGAVSATPNPLSGATPLRSRRDVGATPRGESAGPGATPMRTPARDNLKINREGETPLTGVGETPREIKMRQMDAKRQLQQGFLALPKPKNDFELVLPEEEQEKIVEKVEAALEGIEDAGDRDLRIQQVRKEEEEKALARRTQAIKRGLPRPVTVDAQSLLKDLEAQVTGDLEVERLVAREMIELLQNDSILYPVHGGRQPGGGRSTLAQIDDDSLAAARALVHKELATESGFPGASEEALKGVIAADPDEYARIWTETTDGYAFDASTRTYVEANSLTAEQRKAGLEALLEDSRVAMVRDANAAAKTEKRLAKTLGGYQARAKTLGEKLAGLVDDLNRSALEFASFERLAGEEEGAVVRRVESLRDEVRKLESREREGQSRYKELSEERGMLAASIEEMQAELTMREAEAANEAALAAMED